MAETSYMIAPGETTDSLALRRKIALALAQKTMQPPQIDHWAQGLAHLADSAYSGYEVAKLGREEKEETAKGNALLASLFNPSGGGQPTPVAQQEEMPPPPPRRAVAAPPGQPPAPVAPMPPPAAPVTTGRAPVMSSPKVWGDKEAQDAGLYPPDPAAPPQPPSFNDRYAALQPSPVAGGMQPRPVQTERIAQALQLPQQHPQASAPTPVQMAQAQSPQQGGINRDAIVRMLGNRKTAPIAQGIIQQHIGQQFKPREYKIEITPDGRVIAADTKDPTKVQTTSVPGAGRAAIEHAASKAAAEKVATRVATEGMPATSEEATKLRTEVQGLPSYKNLTQAAPIYKTMLDSAGRNTRASDLNLVYGLGKIFDPGSVVREGEMVMVKNTASVPDWLVGAANSLNGGAALQPATRDAIMREAFSRIQSYKSVFDQDVSMYRGIADRNKMRQEDVIPNFGEFTQWQRPDATSKTKKEEPTAQDIMEELRKRKLAK